MQLRFVFVVSCLAVMILLSLNAPRTASARLVQEPGSLLITEVYYDTPGDDGLEEWFEVTNIGQGPLSLADYKIGDEETPGGGEGMLSFPDGASLQAQESAVIAQTAQGFNMLFGFLPDYEIKDSDPTIPDMLPYSAWGRGDFALNNDGDEILLLDADDIVVDAVSYGASNEFMAPSVLDVARGQSIGRVPAHCDSDSAGDWQPQNIPSPGTVNRDGDCTLALAAEPELSRLPIGAIQGSGDSSPMINEIVHFEGIVTGLLEDRNTRGAIFHTLFVQELPGNEDGDPLTSDAIAVFHGPRRPSFLPGDVVRVTGQVTEFFGMTEIDDSGLNIQLIESDHPLPPAVQLQPDMLHSHSYFEPLEAMHAELPEAVVIGPTFSGCGISVAPGSAYQRYVRQQLSDELGPLMPVLHISDVDCGDFPQVKTGDLLQGLQGPLVYHFDQFKIVHQFASDLVLTPAADPVIPRAPVAAAQQISVATFNVHDFFDAIDDTGTEAEPKPEPADVQLKQTKLARTIAESLKCPTVLAVQEVENAALLHRLAQELQTSCLFRYAVAHEESVDARGIDLGLLVDPRRVQIVSVAMDQACAPLTTELIDSGITCPPGQDPLFSRPPLRVSLEVDGEPYTVVVVHFKSKREGEQETAPRRLAQAGVVSRLMRDLFENDPDVRVIVLGDFNDYELSTTMAQLTKEPVGLFDASQLIPVEERYTYNFGGISQLLDTILLSPSLASRMVSSQIIHVNADYPAGWAVDSAILLRSSDHDIPLVVLSTVDEQAKPDITPSSIPTARAATSEPDIQTTATVEPTRSGSPAGEGTVTGVTWLPVLGGVVLGMLIGGVLVYSRRKNDR